MDRLEGFSGDDDRDPEGKGACLLLWYPADGGAQPMAGPESQESLEGRLLWYTHVEEGSILTQPEESRVGNYLGQIACGWVGLDC